MNTVAVFLAALSISLPFPSEWLGGRADGYASVTYKLTDTCELQITKIVSDPPNFDPSVALQYLHYATVSDRVTDNWDFIFVGVPGTEQESEVRLQIRTRTVRYGDDTIVCTFDSAGHFKAAASEPDLLARSSLSALPSKEHKLTFQVEQ